MISKIDFQFNLHELQKKHGTPFDKNELSVSGVLSYFCSKTCGLNIYPYKIEVINPDQISYIQNHYEKNPKDRIWSNMLYKERCKPDSGNMKMLQKNPFYYFNGEMIDHDNPPEYIRYKGKLYLLNSGNHRTVIAKYFWHFNKEIIQKNGYCGVICKVSSVKNIDIQSLALYKFLEKRNFLTLKGANSIDFKLQDNQLKIDISMLGITPNKKEIIHTIGNTHEFIAALKWRYLLRNFKKQIHYFKLFNSIFSNYYRYSIIKAYYKSCTKIKAILSL